MTTKNGAVEGMLPDLLEAERHSHPRCIRKTSAALLQQCTALVHPPRLTGRPTLE